MPHFRLPAAATAFALMAGPVLAQPVSPTGAGSITQPSTINGSAESPSTSQPGAPAPILGGPAQPSATSAFTPIQATGGNIIAELTASGEFTKLLAALSATNLTTLISTHANLTLFAPTDAAFAVLPPGELDTLMKSPTQLQAILTYHLVAATIKEGDIKGHAAGQVPTADKAKPVTLDGSGPSLKVDDATVLQSAVAASNGVIYPIDKVLTPPSP